MIRGRQTDDTQGRVFLHRGIAARQFQRAFVLAEGIDITGAWLDSGLLHIDLARPQPEVRVKRIEISKGPEQLRDPAGRTAEVVQARPARVIRAAAAEE